jgi:hypothetical protein
MDLSPTAPSRPKAPGEETSKPKTSCYRRPAMRNPPGRHLLRLTNHVVRSSSSSSGLGANAGASTSAASPRPRPVAGGRPLRASSPPPPSEVAAAAYWESRALRRDGEDGDWEEVVAGPGEMEEEEYRVVFWSPPTIDEVTGAVTSIQGARIESERRAAEGAPGARRRRRRPRPRGTTTSPASSRSAASASRSSRRSASTTR